MERVLFSGTFVSFFGFSVCGKFLVEKDWFFEKVGLRMFSFSFKTFMVIEDNFKEF